MIAFPKHCLLAVGCHVPDARRLRAREVWYGDPTCSRIAWTDGAGRKWRWPPNARLRSLHVVAAEKSRLLDEHWHVHDAQFRGQPVLAHLDAGVVTERRYALSWMVGYGETWDDVPLDT